MTSPSQPLAASAIRPHQVAYAAFCVGLGIIAVVFLAQPGPPHGWAASVSAIALAVFAVLCIIEVAAVAEIFRKAGERPWTALIPFYNYWVLVRISRCSGAWFVVSLIPIANFVAAAVVARKLARQFGKGGGYAVGLLLLSPVFYPMLGYGRSEYVTPHGDSFLGGSTF